MSHRKGIIVESSDSISTANREKLKLTMEYSRLWKESSPIDDEAALKESNSISVQTTPSPTNDPTSLSLSGSQSATPSGKFQSFERLAR